MIDADEISPAPCEWACWWQQVGGNATEDWLSGCCRPIGLRLTGC